MPLMSFLNSQVGFKRNRGYQLKTINKAAFYMLKIFVNEDSSKNALPVQKEFFCVLIILCHAT